MGILRRLAFWRRRGPRPQPRPHQKPHILRDTIGFFLRELWRYFFAAIACWSLYGQMPDTVYTIAQADQTTPALLLDLSRYADITVSMWMTWPAYADDDALALEYGAPSYGFISCAGGFLIDPNSTAKTGGLFEVSKHGASGYSQVLFPRPAAGVEHHYAFVFAADGTITVYVDGALAAATQTLSGGTGNMGSCALYFDSRLSAYLLGQGKMRALTIWAGALTAAQVATIAGVTGPAPVPPVAPTVPPTVPQGGNPGQVLTVTPTGPAWRWLPDSIPVTSVVNDIAQFVQAGPWGMLDTRGGNVVTIGIDPAVVQIRTSVPAHATDGCQDNTYAVDADYRYECVGGAWRRVAWDTTWR